MYLLYKFTKLFLANRYHFRPTNQIILQSEWKKFKFFSKNTMHGQEVNNNLHTSTFILGHRFFCECQDFLLICNWWEEVWGCRPTWNRSLFPVSGILKRKQKHFFLFYNSRCITSLQGSTQKTQFLQLFR